MLKFDSSRPAPFGFVTEGFCETIGRTPLLRLRKLSEATGCEIWGKAEFLNPGGSVKDRAALGIVLDAEASGALEPGGLRRSLPPRRSYAPPAARVGQRGGAGHRLTLVCLRLWHFEN